MKYFGDLPLAMQSAPSGFCHHPALYFTVRMHDSLFHLLVDIYVISNLLLLML